MRLTLEEVDKRRAQLDSCALSMFEHLGELKSFFVEVCPIQSQHHHCLFFLKNLIDNLILQGISDRVPLVKVVVPKNQSHSFITQGSPDTMVRFGLRNYAFPLIIVNRNDTKNVQPVYVKYRKSRPPAVVHLYRCV